MRKGLSLFLSMVLLFSFIPFNVEANSFVKDIDALFGDFQLKVNGKRVVNHKESFLYDEELFVSLSDLAKGLAMDINISKNNAHMNSKGKLNFNAETGKESIIFQRGYEISAKERIIESLDDEIRILDGKAPAGIDYKIKSNLKSIKVGFGNINIYLDGKKLNLDSDTLRYKNDIYVPLDSIAPYLYITPTMSKDKTTINIDANGILVKDSYYSTMDSLLAAREGRNYLMDIQRGELEKRKYLLKEFQLPYKKLTTINSLEDYLNKNFNKVGELDVNLDIVQQYNLINLDISFPASKNNLWNKLSRSDVEQWIWNIYTAILNLYNDEALISGVVRNPYYAYYPNSDFKNYITFYSKDKDIYFDFTKSKLVVDKKVDPDYLVEVLNKNLPKYQNTSFTYDARMSGDKLELMAYPTPDNFNKLSLFIKMGYLKTLNQRIKELYPDLVVEGKIVYLSDSLPSIDFYISENRISSTNLLKETEKYINNSFGYFSHGNNGFKLKHSLYEKDLKNYHLDIETDFSINDSKWVNAGDMGKQKLSTNVHNALSFILSLWDANISTTVVDKNGVLITDFDSYQETVSVVHANPPSGEVVEGSKILLSTDTSLASIYYTLDGSTPTTSSLLYDGEGIIINGDVEINAIGYKEGLGSGPVSTFRYTIVRDENISYGLTNLSVDPGTLNRPFSNTTTAYTVNVGEDVSTIDITPYATNGVITVSGSTVVSGESISVALNSDSTTIRISVKESNKNERIYTIVANKVDGGSTNVFSVVDIRFNTLFGLIFSGRISHGSISDFSGYEVEVLTKSGVSVATVEASSDGEFSFPNTPVSAIDKIIGFKYRVYDGNGKLVVPDKNLN